jgi:hypothetical protein
MEPFQGNLIKLFFGKAMVILGAGIEPGETILTASSEGLGNRSEKFAIK